MTNKPGTFGERECDRLRKLFRSLGTDNENENAAATGRISSLLLQFGKGWDDLVDLLSGGALRVSTALAADLAGLGDPDTRASARHNISELLARHRKGWNDLCDALSVLTPAPWLDTTPPEPERAPDLIGLIVHLIREYVELRSEHEYIAVALWILHTHRYYSDSLVTPRLALRSATAGCGKTTLMDILSRLVARPEKFDAITPAALLRLIDAAHPTLLLDEVDNLMLGLSANGKIRAIFNSGHRSGGTVGIAGGNETRTFSTFAPLALALPDAMAGLPRTLNSRCITIHMQRAQRELRRLKPIRADPALDACHAQILLWRNDAELSLDPEMPKELRNRLADNWRPLIAIADSLGWGKEAREAAIAFALEFEDADVRILALTDIRRAFDACGLDHMPSKALLEALHGVDDSDWHEFRGLRGDQSPHKLKDSELAAMLREFKIRPRSIWPLHRTAASKSQKGYRRSEFEAVWRAYGIDGAGTAAHGSKTSGLRLASGGSDE